MSKSNSYKYLNNVLYGIKRSIPTLIKFYQSKKPQDWSEAMILGGHKSILFGHLSDKKLLPHIDLKTFFDLCDKISDLCYEEPDETGYLSLQKTLKNIDLVFEGWTNLYNETLKVLLKELVPYQENFNSLEGEQLKDYCYNLLDYDKKYYHPEYLENFFEIINDNFKSKLQKVA